MMLNRLKNIPTKLKKTPQWVVWRLTEKPDRPKPAKIPCSPLTGAPCGINDPSAWSDFQTAVKALKTSNFNGLGFCFTEADPFVGIDLDHCVENGQVAPWAREITDRFQSYVETSPSGRGLHVILEGHLPGGVGGKRKGAIEIYQQNRFFTITGDLLPDSPTEIRARQGELTKFFEEVFSDSDRPEATGDGLPDWWQSGPVPREDLSLADLSLLQKAESAQNGAKFAALWAGDIAGYPSQSEADQALANILVYWTEGDLQQADRLFRASGLYRPKWDSRRGQTAYGLCTLEKAAEKFSQGDRAEDSSDYNVSVLKEFCLTAKAFTELVIPEKRKILDPIITEQNIILVAADRGVGKTFFALGLLDAITRGVPFGPWPTVNSVPALFFDAELVPQDLQARLNAFGLQENRQAPLYCLSDALLVEKGRLPKANIQNPNWRKAIKQMLLDLGIKVWCLDNLASATCGTSDENDAATWRDVNGWLLDLRYHGVTTIICHHTNKTGSQRGTHSREDSVDLSLMLKRPAGYRLIDGCAFDVVPTKARLPVVDLKKIHDISFQLEEADDGVVTWATNKPRLNSKKEILRRFGDGERQADIAQVLGCSRANVSGVVRRAKAEGLLTASGKLTEKGRVFVDDFFEIEHDKIC